jgi:hypothetical protein
MPSKAIAPTASGLRHIAPQPGHAEHATAGRDDPALGVARGAGVGHLDALARRRLLEAGDHVALRG